LLKRRPFLLKRRPFIGKRRPSLENKYSTKKTKMQFSPFSAPNGSPSVFPFPTGTGGCFAQHGRVQSCGPVQVGRLLSASASFFPPGRSVRPVYFASPGTSILAFSEPPHFMRPNGR
jgi:hypothetical protein